MFLEISGKFGEGGIRCEDQNFVSGASFCLNHNLLFILWIHTRSKLMGFWPEVLENKYFRTEGNLCTGLTNLSQRHDDSGYKLKSHKPFAFFIQFDNCLETPMIESRILRVTIFLSHSRSAIPSKSELKYQKSAKI